MRTDHAHTEQYKGLTIYLEHDSDCESPLEGDCEPTITYRKGAREILGNLAQDTDEHHETGRRIANGELIGLPVFAYIHGGVALSTRRGGQFSDPWDSGQSGYIYVTKATALEWHGGKILTAKKRAAVLESLPKILETYSQWLNGECYGYRIYMPGPFDEDCDATGNGGEGEELDSCWGYIGTEYALEEARRSADWHVEDLGKQAETARLAAIHEAGEVAYWAARDVRTVPV